MVFAFTYHGDKTALLDQTSMYLIVKNLTSDSLLHVRYACDATNARDSKYLLLLDGNVMIHKILPRILYAYI